MIEIIKHNLYHHIITQLNSIHKKFNCFLILFGYIKNRFWFEKNLEKSIPFKSFSQTQKIYINYLFTINIISSSLEIIKFYNFIFISFLIIVEKIYFQVLELLYLLNQINKFSDKARVS
jgi:hypothetical protein